MLIYRKTIIDSCSKTRSLKKDEDAGKEDLLIFTKGGKTLFVRSLFPRAAEIRTPESTNERFMRVRLS